MIITNDTLGLIQVIREKKDRLSVRAFVDKKKYHLNVYISVKLL